MPTKLSTAKKTLKLSFTRWLKTLPDEKMFYNGVTDYRGLFVGYLEYLYPKGSVPVRHFYGKEIPSPSTVQRSIALEAKRRKLNPQEKGFKVTNKK